MPDDEIDFRKRCRIWIINMFGTQTHGHYGPPKIRFTSGTIKNVQWVECMDMDDARLDEWDIYADHDEGYSYSEYTWEPARSSINARFPTVCPHSIGPTTYIEIGSGSDLNVAFGKLIRELASIDVTPSV